MPKKSSPAKSSKSSPAKQVKFNRRATDILVIAPHGVDVKGTDNDDINTAILAEKIAAKLECSALINDSISRDDCNYNSIASAENDKVFFKNLRSVLDSAGPTLVVWIHGIGTKSLRDEKADMGHAGRLDCLIGFGQPDRHSIPETVVDALISLLDVNGVIVRKTLDGADNYRGWAKDNMNQWFHSQKKYNDPDEVQSVQLEFSIYKRRKDLVEGTAESVSTALSALVRPVVEDAEKEPVLEIVPEPEVLDDDAKTPVDDPGDIDLKMDPESDEKEAPEATNLPAVTDGKSDVAVPTGSPEEVAEQAYKWLEARYRKCVAVFALEAGEYIIKTFYGGDPRLALAKNKAKEQPSSLRLLINKFHSTTPSGDTPSETWFYRAVGLAAQMAIAKQMGLSALTILGHSHRIELLNYPKLKEIKADEFDAAIEPAFRVKEELAQVAVEKNLTTRKFGKYIKKQHPAKPASIDLTALPPRKALREQDPSVLRRLYNLARNKIDEGQQAVRIYGKALNNLGAVLVEMPGNVGEGKGRFQDWTKSKNNINICTGCRNDCLYCYMKPINIRNSKFKQPVDWHKWELRQKDVDVKQRLRDGLVGFPSSHDIFPEILDAYLEVMGKILRAGNEVLIVSKPRLDCIKAICDASTFFKDKVLFRFTIGAMDGEILSFWEPNAPAYDERKACLEHAKERGFRTSVSMEPMLDTPQIEALVADLDPLVTGDIWLGMMSHLKGIKNWANKEGFENRKQNIEIGQSPPVLTAIYETYQDNPKIKWKTETLKVITDHLKETDRLKGNSKIKGEKIVAGANPVKVKFKGWEEIEIKMDAAKDVKAIAPVIVSASRRTDIPSHYADWFMDCLRRGYLAQTYPTSRYIAFNNTRLITFWTKNPEPMLQHLDEIDKMEIGYYFQFTLNNYENEGLEPNLPPLQQRIETFKTLSDKIGKEKVVWRFDPLVLTDVMTPDEILVGKVSGLMEQISGYTEKLVISFLQASKHKKVERNLTKAGIKYRDFGPEDVAFVAQHLGDLGKEHHIQVATCSDSRDLSKYGIGSNKCIDDALIRRCFPNDAALMAFVGDGTTILKDKGQRPLCGCLPSVDIGMQNTCLHLCHYCYANVSEKAVNANRKRITGTGEFLVPPISKSKKGDSTKAPPPPG